MLSADQLLCHAFGDYVLQSDWMATEKTKRFTVAIVHAVCYSLPFLALRPSLAAWLVIVLTHALIDRYRLARYVVWAKEWLSPYGIMSALYGRLCWTTDEEDRTWGRAPSPLADCPTGYPADKPAWLAVWLLIIADNAIHVLISGLALRYL